MLHPAPAGLTTEHIKSHLQKYRTNCQKTRKLFLDQYDIARAQMKKLHAGKALKPDFHAYPMPLGKIPMNADRVLKPESDLGEDEKVKKQHVPVSKRHPQPQPQPEPEKLSDARMSNLPLDTLPKVNTASGQWIFVPTGSKVELSRTLDADRRPVDHYPERPHSRHYDREHPLQRKRPSTISQRSAVSQNSTVRRSSNEGLGNSNLFDLELSRSTDSTLAPLPVDLTKRMEEQIWMHQQIKERHKKQHFDPLPSGGLPSIVARNGTATSPSNSVFSVLPGKRYAGKTAPTRSATSSPAMRMISSDFETSSLSFLENFGMNDTGSFLDTLEEVNKNMENVDQVLFKFLEDE